MFGAAAPDTGNMEMLAAYGTEEQKKRWLEPLLNQDMFSAYSMTEPQGGSDPNLFKTHAVRDGDEWIINGAKLYITNGTQADWLCLLARTSDAGGHRGMSQIIVPTDTPGFSVSRKLDKLGNRASDTAELSFVDVRVPVANTIGEIDRGFQQQMAQFQNERLIAAYSAVGGLRYALDRTIEYVRQRQAFGQTLADKQWVQFNLAQLVAEVDLARQYNYACAEAICSGADGATITKMASIAKLKTGRLHREVADWCMQLYGGIGYMEETWTARFYRDSRLLSIGGGSDEMMLRIIAQLEGIGDPV
jgi:citronellyl-CoA dehydrogenase